MIAAGGQRTRLACQRRIAPGVILEEVHADRVVLRHDGVQEVLALARDELPKSAPAPGPVTGTAPLRNTAPGSPAHVGTAPLTFTPPNIAHGAAGNWQQTMDRAGAGDMAALAKNVQVTPVIEDGRMAGVRVHRRRHRPARPPRPASDDVITAVNGVPVDSRRGQRILETRQCRRGRVAVMREACRR